MREKIRSLIKSVILMIRVLIIVLKCKIFKKRIFLMYTPTRSSNMGDQAIRMGQLLFLKTFFTEYKIIECDKYIWCEQHESAIRLLKKVIKKQDLIMIQGGGYIGDLWTGCEEDFRRIIADFPENKIVALPNTAYYSDTSVGRQFLAEDREFYKKHKNVLFFLRDRQSYSLMCDMAGAEHCFYMPDMALMLEPEYKPLKKDILICTRHDHEKVQSTENIEKLKEALEHSGYSVKYTDTVKSVSKAFKWSKRKRNEVFEATMEEFAGARLIITDRLHGMVISAINKTPCIAMDNVSKKVSGVYEWLKHLSYIRVMDFDDISVRAVKELLQAEPIYNNDGLMVEFEKMAKEIKDYWES